MEYAEVDGDFDHVPKGGAIRLKNRGNVRDGLFSLLFNRLAHQFPLTGQMGRSQSQR